MQRGRGAHANQFELLREGLGLPRLLLEHLPEATRASRVTSIEPHLPKAARRPRCRFALIEYARPDSGSNLLLLSPLLWRERLRLPWLFLQTRREREQKRKHRGFAAALGKRQRQERLRGSVLGRFLRVRRQHSPIPSLLLHR